MKTGFQLNKPIQLIQPYSNIDMFYGPYDNIEEACEQVPLAIRQKGLTIGILNNNGEVEEYWWKAGINNNQLVEKVEAVDLKIARIGDYSTTVQEGEPINLSFSVEGRAIISKAYLYQFVNGQEIFVQDFSSITKGVNTVTIQSPNSAGVYKYHIKVADTGGYNAKTEDQEEFIEYEVRYGGMSIIVNTSNFDRIKIKNIQSMAEQYFTINMSVRDDSFVIEKVELYDGENASNLIPYKSLTELSDTYLGLNYYILPNQDELQPFDGNRCYVRVTYTEDGTRRYETRELFILLKLDSLEIYLESVQKDYYINFPDYYKFLLQSGVQNVSIYVQQQEDSDFTFTPVTVSAYNTYSLRIVPNKLAEEAYLSMKCSFVINNVEFVKTFKVNIGSIINIPERQYYEPPAGSSITLDRTVIATEDDLVDGTKYYKILNNFTSNEYSTCSFLVDMYCRIQQENDKSLKYVRILQGNNEIGYITEDVINCRGIITDTPLNEWVLISLGYNLEESILRVENEDSAKYFAIYINGMVVKNIQIASNKAQPIVYNIDTPITVELSNGINVSKCLVYYSNGQRPTINPNTSRYSIPYNNYLSYNALFEEPGDLPVLKLRRITDDVKRTNWFNWIKDQNEDLVHLTKFGTIGLPKALNNMSEYDPLYEDGQMDHDNATLFRQSVNIKKPALKAYAVLCEGEWMVDGNNILSDCVIEVHTQGTSTLVYPVPNFKFTFWKQTPNGIEHFNPPFIKNNDGGYYDEYVYTAKADFMDSSHLNNTPTCNFYNTLIHNLIEDDRKFPEFAGSPSARNGGIDAIMGFPIVMEIGDEENMLLNIGSFMLNVDKTGKSLGFEVLEEGQTLSCISFEGTSNDNAHGAAGRFINKDNIPYFDSEDEIQQEGTKIATAIKASGKKLNLDSELDGVKVSDYKYVRWCKFLSDGLEYRYPDSDIYKTSTSGTTTYLTKIMSVNDFKPLYRMWKWVAESDNYTNTEYKQGFVQHFDLYYCMLYFIQLMIFAQTDNLGKNAMFDCWDGEHWYPRPYDLDSQAGLDNNGNDNIAPFVEIKPEFSLNYDPSYTREQMEEEYLIQEEIIDEEGNIRTIVSQIPYAGLNLDRYHFSSNTSKLWINFYKNYKGDIEAFYRRLRTDANYDSASVIDMCNDMLIDKLGVHQYNQDFLNKYLATNYQELALGNRWYKFKKWMIQRFAFCDSYFGMGETALYGLVSTMPEYVIEVESPQYVRQTYLDQGLRPYFVVESKTMPSSGSGGATKFTLNVNQSQVLSSGHFRSVVNEGDEPGFDGLITLDVSGNKQISTINNLVGTSVPRLKQLNANNSSIQTLKNIIPQSLRKLTALNVSIDSIDFPEGCLVEEINLTGATIGNTISFSNLPNLKKLDISNCTFNSDIRLELLPSLEQFIFTGAKFNGNIIISNKVNINDFNFYKVQLNGIVFTGNDVNVKKLNFIESRFTQDTINLNAIANNIEELYFNGCSGITHLEVGNDITFRKLNTFSIYGSSIKSIGSDNTKFNAAKFTALSGGISGLKRVSSYNTNTGIPTAYTQFTFYNTKVLQIINLSWNGTGENLFRDCFDLTSISGTINLTTNMDYLFYKCDDLATIPTINVGSTVTSAQWSFAGTLLLNSSVISDILRKCTNVTNFSSCCRGCSFKTHSASINLDYIFGNNPVVQNLSYMFCEGGYSADSRELPRQNNTLSISGKIPVTAVNIQGMFLYCSKLSIPYNILSNARDLEDSSGVFYGAVVNFSGGPEYMGYRLNNTIDQDFFYSGTEQYPNKITTIRGMFFNSNVAILNANIFRNLTSLERCEVCFYRSGNHFFVYTYMDGSTQRQLDLSSIVIDSIWESNSRLQNVGGCFYGVNNVLCMNTLTFNDAVRNINITGVLGTDGRTDNDYTIRINILSIAKINDSLTRTVTYSGSISTFSSSSSALGLFANRNVNILDTPDSNGNAFGCLRGDCAYIFIGSRLYMNESIQNIDLSNVTNGTRMFESCVAYKQNEDQLYDDDHRIFFDFILPTSCSLYYRMFLNSSVLKHLPQLRAFNSSNLLQMYYGAVINQEQVRLNADYFLICKNNLTNVYGMFLQNRYITELLYDKDCGLFDGCINLADVRYMFSNAGALHKGIPNNLFGSVSLPKITSLQGMFEYTNIFYDVEGEVAAGGKKWMDSETVVPLTKLTSIESAFQYHNMYIGDWTLGGYSGTIIDNTIRDIDDNPRYVIDPLTFSVIKLQNIRNAFKYNRAIKNVPFRFAGFVLGEDAFAGSAIEMIDSDFVSIGNISEVQNVSRMFYMRSDASPKTVQNLGLFVDNLTSKSNAIKSNIAGNLANTDVDAALKQPVSDEYGHGWSTVYRKIYL